MNEVEVGALFNSSLIFQTTFLNFSKLFSLAISMFQLVDKELPYFEFSQNFSLAGILKPNLSAALFPVYRFMFSCVRATCVSCQSKQFQDEKEKFYS